VTGAPGLALFWPRLGPHRSPDFSCLWICNCRRGSDAPPGAPLIRDFRMGGL